MAWQVVVAVVAAWLLIQLPLGMLIGTHLKRMREPLLSSEWGNRYPVAGET